MLDNPLDLVMNDSDEQRICPKHPGCQAIDFRYHISRDNGAGPGIASCKYRKSASSGVLSGALWKEYRIWRKIACI